MSGKELRKMHEIGKGQAEKEHDYTWRSVYDVGIDGFYDSHRDSSL
jgi:hypothetical protein